MHAAPLSGSFISAIKTLNFCPNFHVLATFHVLAHLGTDIAHTIALLRQGHPVALPTATVYGLAANAFDTQAITQVFAIKARPAFDPLIVHARDFTHAASLVTTFPPLAQRLARAFWPGPLTLLLPKTISIPDLVTAGLPHVALRVPQHAVIQQVLQAIDFPLAAPSANPFGYISPTTAQHVVDQLGSKVAYILDGGPCQIGLESTIVGFNPSTGKLQVHRLGGLPVEAIEAVVGSVQINNLPNSHPAAPGKLSSHYAPRTRLWLGDVPTLWARLSLGQQQRVGILTLRQRYDFPAARHEVLAPNGNLAVAAQRFFATLRAMDAAGLELILADRMPAQGLGPSINERLQRAADDEA